MDTPTPQRPTAKQLTTVAARKVRQKEQAKARMARLRERRGPATTVSIDLPPSVAGAVARVLTSGRRGFSGGYRRALLIGAMMDTCAGDSDMAAILGTEFSTIKTYLAEINRR